MYKPLDSEIQTQHGNRTVKLRVTAQATCAGCFYESSCSTGVHTHISIVGNCTPAGRGDRLSIIFEEIKQYGDANSDTNTNLI